VEIRHPRAVKNLLAPICIVATFCNSIACQEGDTTFVDSTTGDMDDTTGKTSVAMPTGTGETTADVEPTSTTKPGDPTSTGEPEDDTTSDPPPDPTTGEPDECPDRPAGSYQDCVNGEACDGRRATCLVDDPDNESFGICSLYCVDDCDCFADPGNAGASSACVPLLEGGEKVCVLDCSGGKSCPAGSFCQTDYGICVYGLANEEQADLELTEFYLDAHELEPGAPTVMNFAVTNVGAAATPSAFQLSVVISQNAEFGDADDILVIEGDYPNLVDPGQTEGWYADIQIPAELFDGAYYVGMKIDSADVIDESDEDNNVLFDPDQVIIVGNPMPGNADLSLENALAGAHAVLQGSETGFSFDVKNLAPDAVPAYSVGLYYSTDPTITTADALICTHNDDDGLAGLAEEAVQIDCVVPKLVGTRYFGAIVDPAGALDELDEDNNVAADADPVTISAPNVDLVMGAVSSNDNTVDTGQLVTLSATVSNGGADASPGFGVSFYLSTDANITAADKLVCTQAAGAPLPAGQQTVVSLGCTIPPVSTGAYWLGAIADPGGLIAETDEGNNDGASAAQLQVKAPDVDLEYFLLWDNSFTPSPGETVTYHVQIRNNGTAASPAKFDASIMYSLDDAFNFLDAEACTVSVGPVPAKTITEFQFDCDIPAVAPGWYYRGVIIDSGNVVPETNEGNNAGGSVNPELIQ
jgi:CARDB